MEIDELKANLQHVVGNLKDLEERARKLDNQNLADIIKSAHSRITQFSDHADLGLITDKPVEAEQTPLPFDPASVPPGAAA